MTTMIKDHPKLIFIGIDPGKTGCAAAVNSESIFFHEWISPEAAKDWLLSVWAEYQIALAVIEDNDQRRMPHKGRIGAYDLAYICGTWIGLLCALSIPYVLVSPCDWQRAMIGSHIIVRNPKHRSILAAKKHDQRLAHVLYKIKDHNRADAVNMAFYAQMRYHHDVSLKKRRVQ